MTRTVQSLDGDVWTVREALGETWRWYVAAPVSGWGNNAAEVAATAGLQPGWLPARVPGSVITDLTRCGELADPYRGRNSRSAEWTGARHWVYRRAVRLDALAPDDRGVLEFDGADPSASVLWDGRELGRIEGTFRPARFPVPADCTTPGEHVLSVVIDPVPDSQPQVGRTDLVRVHRPRMNYGWDFCPRLPNQGIWRGVRLVVASAHIAHVSARADLAEDGRGTVRLRAIVDTAHPIACELRVLDPDGAVVARAEHSGASGRLELEATVTAPTLWWPQGYGEAALYTAQLYVADELAWTRRTGFRTAEFVANPGAPGDARPYTARVNGVRMPLPGWNWAPADAQYGAASRARVEHLVDLAARSGARLLRVWGGGLLETEEFYDACDRAGILVWQEFSQSSSGRQSAPAGDPGFVALMAAEAEAVVPPRTHHPSLFLWGGGNELDLDDVPLDDARSPVLAALHERVAALDPGRAWTPTSPTGPAFHNRLADITAAPDAQHDVHGPWEHQGPKAHHTLYNAGTSLAHTEFGVEGMANLRTLEHLVPETDRWPADRSNPVYRHLGDWWNNAELVRAAFGSRLHDLHTLQRASQLLQATGLGYAVEADRRRYPRCSMVLPWQLAESYPNAWCTACVDHRGDPKPAFHAVARAFRPVRISARTTTSVWAGEAELAAEVWLWAEHGEPAGSNVQARLRAADGTVLGEASWHVGDEVVLPRAVGTLRVPVADVPADAPVVWDLTWAREDAGVLDRDVVLAATGADFGSLLDLAPAVLDVGVAGNIVEIHHRGGPMVLGMQLVDARPFDAPGWVVADGDPRPLLPGGTRSLAVHIRDVPGPVEVLLESWNSTPVPLSIDPETSR